jgi:spore germination cell wall hydrolase CwlJ-like protein
MKRKNLIWMIFWSLAVGGGAQASDLNGHDRVIIATCMVLEAGGEGSTGMQAVLSVMRNRAQGDAGRLADVALKRGAFSCMAPVWQPEPDFEPLISKARNQSDAYEEALCLIQRMEQGELEDNTGGATHYHAHYVTPYWASTLRYLTTIGGHLFYREPSQEMAQLSEPAATINGG